jgi:hypothetical protein
LRHDGSTEPLGLVFDPEAQTRRELVAERLAEVPGSVRIMHGVPKAFGNSRAFDRGECNGVWQGKIRKAPVPKAFGIVLWLEKPLRRHSIDLRPHSF